MNRVPLADQLVWPPRPTTPPYRLPRPQPSRADPVGQAPSRVAWDIHRCADA